MGVLKKSCTIGLNKTKHGLRGIKKCFSSSENNVRILLVRQISKAGGRLTLVLTIGRRPKNGRQHSPPQQHCLTPARLSTPHKLPLLFLRPRQKTPPINFNRPQTVSASAKEGGWGGRIRTFGCRLQRPMPYRLATPHPVSEKMLHRGCVAIQRAVSFQEASLRRSRRVLRRALAAGVSGTTCFAYW